MIERDIEQRIPEQSVEIILYRGGEYRSVLAVDALQKMGYTRVDFMMGGFCAWVHKGYSNVKV